MSIPPSPTQTASPHRLSTTTNVSDAHAQETTPLLPPDIPAPMDIAPSNRSSWYSFISNKTIRPEPQRKPQPVAYITDKDINSLPTRVVVGENPSANDLPTRLYADALLCLEKYISSRNAAARYYMANECLFIAYEEYSTLHALAKFQSDRPTVDQIEIRVLTPRDFMASLYIKPWGAVALRKAQNGYPAVNLVWDNPYEGTMKLCYVPSSAAGFYKNGGQNTYQKYIQVTIANYADAFSRGELDIYEGSIHFCDFEDFGIYPGYTHYLVRLLTNIKRLDVMIKAEKASNGELTSQLTSTRTRYLWIVAAMCDNLDFGDDISPDEKKLFNEVTKKQWDVRVPVERRTRKD